MKTVNPATASYLLREDTKNGKIFSVDFIKKTNGKRRKMVCRRGVKKGVKGVGMAYYPPAYGLLNVYDMQKGNFRNISLSNVVEFKVNGETFQVDIDHYKTCMNKDEQ